MDPFDQFWQWAEKPLESPLTIPAELHRAVMELAARNGWSAKRSTRPRHAIDRE